MLPITLTDFVAAYDHPGAVILLEGKRAVPAADAPLLTAIGRTLAGAMKHATFRSGNAPGADALFAAGVAAVDERRMEIIVPYSGHRKSAGTGYLIHSLDDIDVAAEPEVVYHSKQHKAAERHVDRYVAGQRDVASIKASYIIRDTVKVLGTKVPGAEGIPPATFGIFYDNLTAPGQGGTGHTMRVCREAGVPLVDQQVWMEWIG